MKLILDYTKILVGIGTIKSGEKNEVEIIDLEWSASHCSNLEDFPGDIGEMGGLEFSNNPLICGGYQQNKCFSWKDSAWQVFPSLTEARSLASSCPSPFHKESHKLLVAGGSNEKGCYQVLNIF
jgi:hypothetical protein